MFGKKWLFSFVSIVVLLAASSSAFACACCIERGFYDITSAKPDKFYLGLLGEMKFAGPAELYLPAAEFEAIKGLDDLKRDADAGKSIDFDVVEAFLQRSWRINVKTGAGRAGSLMLPLPATMVRYRADHHDTETGREVSLYKEFIFKGRVATGTGIFRTANAKPTAYALVFQGRGNGCDNASDFTHWRLELNGAQANYAFFGKFK